MRHFWGGGFGSQKCINGRFLHPKNGLLNEISKYSHDIQHWMQNFMLSRKQNITRAIFSIVTAPFFNIKESSIYSKQLFILTLDARPQSESVLYNHSRPFVSLSVCPSVRSSVTKFSENFDHWFFLIFFMITADHISSD